MNDKKRFVKNYNLLIMYCIISFLVFLIGIIFFAIFITETAYVGAYPITASIIGGSTIIILLGLFLLFYFAIPDTFTLVIVSNKGLEERKIKKSRVFLSWDEISIIKDGIIDHNIGRRPRWNDRRWQSPEVKAYFESSDTSKRPITFIMTKNKKQFLLHFNQNPNIKESLENLRYRQPHVATLYIVRSEEEFEQLKNSRKGKK